MRLSLSKSGIWISLLVIFVAVILFIRDYNHEPQGDEVYYEYVWENDDPTDMWDENHRYERKVSSWSDIWQTQVKHYMRVNGRALIHTTEQAFTGHNVLFCTINTIMFFIFVGLIIYYVAPSGRRDNYFLWLSVIMILILGFPLKSMLWVYINASLNYLWPAVLAMAVLISWERIITGQLKRRYIPFIVLLALVFGWTNELFVVPIAGAMFFYYCFHFRQFRGQVLALAIPMWLTGILLVFSPGNFARYFRDSASGGSALVSKIVNSVDLMSHAWIFITMTVCTIVLLLIGKKDNVKSFVSNNEMLVTALIVSLCFTGIANSYEQSIIFIELSSMLLILRYICGLEWRMSRLLVGFSVVLTLCFGVHQVVLARDAVSTYRYQHNLIEEFLESPDGMVHYSHAFVSRTSLPYVLTWLPNAFHARTIAHVKTNGKKEITLLPDADYMAVSQPDSFFVEKNRLPGNAPLYYGEGGLHYWMKPGILKPGQRLVADLLPLDWSHYEIPVLYRLKILLTHVELDNRMDLEIDTVDSQQFGKLYRVRFPMDRKIKAVNVEE